MKTIPYSAVKLGGFWGRRLEINRTATIPTVYDRFTDTGRFEAFKFNWKEGSDLPQPHFFWDSDIAKWIEAAAYSLALHPDKKLEKIIDETVDLIEKNQQEDGYFNIYFTVVEPGKRFTIRDYHELYCAGHLTEAAIAYYNATGKDKFLKIMCKYIDLIEKVFAVEHSAEFDTPGHEEIELALIKLWECTGDERYLKLCKYFIDTRGTSEKDRNIPSWAKPEYYQSDIPVRDFTFAEGHAVRAMYLYSGMADLAEKTGDKELLDTCERVFDNVRNRQMYITGGIGATSSGERFTEDYVLSNDLAYAETCASIALALFARRMSRISHDSKYADVAETAIYNGSLAGVSLDGHSFFYINPLEINLEDRRRNKEHYYFEKTYEPITQRVEVFGCSCCPPNIARFVASIADFLYSYDDSTVYVHHFAESETEYDGMYIKQQTSYPNEGGVRITVRNMAGRRLAVRIPGWCEFVSLGGEKLNAPVEKGYACIDIKSEEETLDFWFEMKPRFVCANPKIGYDAGKVCLCRGPLVYCAESVLNDGARLSDISLDVNGTVGLTFDEEAGVYAADADAFEDAPSEELYFDCKNAKRINRKIRMLPYFAYANHGESDMAVWLRKG
ncbi:MAG: glycoside hydrolase family 127 protein [Clostridia bacterium]|nr:glycoside hydrolase family 127 protein [Clostridia bacterium]